MKTPRKSIKSAILLAVLPLVATAAASAHQWIQNDHPLTTDVDHQVAAEEQLGTSRTHVVSLNQAGVIEGRIATIDAETKQTSGLAALNIFFVQNGEIMADSKTSDDGTFMVEGLDVGAYSFVATGKNGFAAYGVRVVAHGDDDATNVMEAAAVSPKMAAVREILNDRLPAEITKQIVDNADDATVEHVVGSNRVRLQNNTLTGHVLPIVGDVQEVKGTYVYILREDQKVAEVQADENGSFMVRDVEPGVYNFVAAGPSGFAAVSFQAIEESPASDSDEIHVSLPALQDGIPVDVPANDSMDIYLTSAQDNGVIYDNADQSYTSSPVDYPIEYAGESVGCGSSVGGSCGCSSDFSSFSSAGGGCCGGGGAGRGIGLGRLLLLGAGIAIPLAVSGGPDDPGPISPAS